LVHRRQKEEREREGMDGLYDLKIISIQADTPQQIFDL
jgi:hypothetical protein